MSLKNSSVRVASSFLFSNYMRDSRTLPKQRENTESLCPFRKSIRMRPLHGSLLLSRTASEPHILDTSSSLQWIFFSAISALRSRVTCALKRKNLYPLKAAVKEANDSTDNVSARTSGEIPARLSASRTTSLLQRPCDIRLFTNFFRR